jgi:hypothetical protein
MVIGFGLTLGVAAFFTGAEVLGFAVVVAFFLGATVFFATFFFGAGERFGSAFLVFLAGAFLLGIASHTIIIEKWQKVNVSS